MNIECPNCHTKYRLKKVPSNRVTATCKKCGEKFHFDPLDVSMLIKPQQEEKVKSVEKTLQMDKQKGVGMTMVLTALIIGVAAVGILQFNKKPFSEKKVAEKTIDYNIDYKINYWDAPIPETITINEIEYTVIDDNLKWFSVLYRDQNFDAVEKHIFNLLTEKNEINSYKLQTLYIVLSKIPDENDIDRMKTVLDEWCDKHPNSHIPWLVRGSFYIKLAWRIRGGGVAKTVKNSAWPKFREKLRLAETDLEKSYELYRNDANSSTLLIEVGIGLKFPREKIEQYYQNGLSACPFHFGLHLEKLRYLKPKWYGSKKEMFDFAEHCLAQSKQYPYLGLVMVDALFETHNFISKEKNFLGRGDIWPRVENIYAAFFAKYPDNIRRHFYYAYHAQIANKHDIAFEQFEIIGDRWMENTCWDSIKYFNNGRALAYINKGNEFLLKKRLYEISIGYFEKAVKCNPNDYALYRLGQAYMYSGLTTRNSAYLQKAETTLQKAIDLKGPNEKYAKDELKKLRKYTRQA
jgi:predicted Zn finger-like uncharacterized protein